MARKSSRKSSSGDEALLWGIAAVVVAIVGVGTAIMLTGGKSACADVQCSTTNQVKTGKTTWKTSKSECCKSRPSSKPAPNLGLTCGTAANGTVYPYSCGDYGTLKKNPTQFKCGTVCTKEMCCDKPGSGGHHGSGPAVKKKQAAKKPVAKKPVAKKPAAAKCCGGDGRCTSYQDKVSCNGKGKVSYDKCYWDETGNCNTENFRMRRWRR